MPSTSRYEKMLFNYETTTRTDLRDGEIKPIVKTEYQGKPKRARTSFKPVNYVYTLMPWRKPMPFYITIKQKEILHTNPHVPQQPYEELPDLEREEVQKTRPRLVMTPAVSMDDIACPKTRQILTKAMYTSEMNAKSREAISPFTNVKSPLPGLPASADPISLPKLKPPYVSKDWLMESVQWDGRQLRGYVAPTREFWLMPDHKPTRCLACEETAVAAKYKKPF